MINQKDINKLIEAKGKNCTSIYIPTYRSGAVQEDQIRFKNALSEALDKLQENGMDKKEAHRYLTKGYDLLDSNKFWLRQSDGLAVFIGPEVFEYFTLPIHFNSMVYLGTQFYVRPLMPMFSDDGRFFLLALSQNEVRFFEGDRYSITPIVIEDLVPPNMEEAIALDEPSSTLQMHGAQGSGGTPMYHGHGLGKDHKVKQIRKYFALIDHGLMEMLKEERVPLILATVDRNAPVYREVSKYNNVLDIHISGNPEDKSPVELHELAWNIMSDFSNRRRDEIKENFGEQLSSNKASTLLTDIIPAAVQGKVATLFIDKDKMIAGNYLEDKHTVQVDDEFSNGNIDLLEFAARKVFKQGGTVFNVDKETFPKPDSPVNAIYRFK